MYCKNCGKEIGDNADFCVHCGAQVNCRPTQNAAIENDFDDSSGKGLAILSFFIPIVGLVLYLIYEKSKPNLAKSAGKGALIGFIARVALAVISTVLYYVLSFALLGLSGLSLFRIFELM